MERLPDEILLTILEKHLHITELVQCRLLSKRFKFLVDNFVRIKKFVFEHRIFPKCVFLEYSQCCDTFKQTKQELPNPNHILRFFGLRFQFYMPLDSSFEILCSKLRCLVLLVKFHFSRMNELALNRLFELEELFIFEPQLMETERITAPELNLPNLKLLAIGWFHAVKSVKREVIRNMPKNKLVVNSKIRQLFYRGFRGYENFEVFLDLKHPEHIQLLKTEHLETKQLSSFVNLRVLHCDRILQSNYEIVKILPNLEEISFTDHRMEQTETASAANHLVDQKNLLGRHNLKIYYFGILLNKPFEEYDFKSCSSLEVVDTKRQETIYRNVILMQLHHYEQLAERLPFVDAHLQYYDRLADGLENLAVANRLSLDRHGLPVGFFERTCIQSIQLSSKIKDVNQFCSFLKQCKWMRELQFTEQAALHLEQSVVDLISDLYALSLTYLLVRGANSELDFRSILKLEVLVELVVRPLNLELVLELFGKSRILESVLTNYKGQMTFTRKKPDKFDFSWYPDEDTKENFKCRCNERTKGIESSNPCVLHMKNLEYSKMKKILYDTIISES